MSSSEFEQEGNSGRNEFASHSLPGRDIPADFNEDDLAFVEELNTVFAAQQEELLPYPVETPLWVSDPRFQPVEEGFEHKTSARVFRRLRLRRRLFSDRPPSFKSMLSEMRELPARRSLFAFTAILMFFMIVTVAFSGPSFASGLEILLHGARSGVYQVRNYPTNVHHPVPRNDTPSEISMARAQDLMHFPIYWPDSLPKDYSLGEIYLYQQQDQSWADGPIVELEYDYSSPGVIPKGTGQIVIREFKPKEDVFQLVQDGSAYPLQVDQNGQARAIYVDGQWVDHGRLLPQWVKGERSELIYQQDGVVFWIVGDQRDGISKDVLMQVANSLRVINITHSKLITEDMKSMIQLVGDLPMPFASDVLVISSQDGTDAPYMITVGNDQPTQEKPT